MSIYDYLKTYIQKLKVVVSHGDFLYSLLDPFLPEGIQNPKTEKREASPAVPDGEDDACVGDCFPNSQHTTSHSWAFGSLTAQYC